MGLADYYRRCLIPKWPQKDGRPGKTGREEQADRRRQRKATEDSAKARVRREDTRCRWPHDCWKHRPRLEVAHLQPKGMGGDPRAKRTRADLMIRFCFSVHQEFDGVERHRKRVVFLSDQGTRGPCSFEEKRGGRWVPVGIECARGSFEWREK